MTIENLLKEFETNKSLSKDSIKYIQSDTEIGKKLVNHFRENSAN